MQPRYSNVGDVNAKRKFARHKSDHLTMLAAYEGWDAARKISRSAEQYAAVVTSSEFCEKNFVSSTRCRAIRELTFQYKKLLKQIGFIHKDQ